VYLGGISGCPSVDGLLLVNNHLEFLSKSELF
jgi:hypothetical protein